MCKIVDDHFCCGQWCWCVLLSCVWFVVCDVEMLLMMCSYSRKWSCDVSTCCVSTSDRCWLSCGVGLWCVSTIWLFMELWCLFVVCSYGGWYELWCFSHKMCAWVGSIWSCGVQHVMCWYLNQMGMDPIDCDRKVKKQQQLKPINKINTTYTSILSYNWFVVVFYCDGFNCCCL